MTADFEATAGSPAECLPIDTAFVAGFLQDLPRARGVRGVLGADSVPAANAPRGSVRKLCRSGHPR